MTETVTPQETPSYSRMTGEIYDLIYSHKNYAAEAEKLEVLIRERCKSGGNDLLEAACGTGNYLQPLSKHFNVEGFDLSAEQVAEARKKLPDTRIIQADMVDFDMGRQYDVVACLFSSIGYLKTQDRLNRALANMARHTKPGGVVIVEPWLKAENFIEGKPSFDSANSNDHLYVARMGVIERNGIQTTLNLHHMVATPQGVEHFLERHELAMFTDEDYGQAFQGAGLTMDIDRVGLTGRGLYIGEKPLQ